MANFRPTKKKVITSISITLVIFVVEFLLISWISTVVGVSSCGGYQPPSLPSLDAEAVVNQVQQVQKISYDFSNFSPYGRGGCPADSFGSELFKLVTKWVVFVFPGVIIYLLISLFQSKKKVEIDTESSIKESEVKQ